MIHALLAAALCQPTFFKSDGRRTAYPSSGPGLVLSGGGFTEMPEKPVLAWMRERVAAPAQARAGNLVILKAYGGRYYTDDFYRESRFAFVQEILIPPCASRSTLDRVVPDIDRANAVLFAGGDQADYVKWAGTELIDAVRRVYLRGGIVGGGSAGLAIQGQVVFDSVAADRVLPNDEDVATPDAVKNPYEAAVSFTTGLFSWPPLQDAITDTHFARRNRFGRLTAFMARALHDRLVNGSRIYGIGVDEGAVLLVNAAGIATMVQRAHEDGYTPRGAYVLEGGFAQRLSRGKPLLYTVHVTHLVRPGTRYDLLHKRYAGGARYSVTVNGASAQVYSRNPYR